MDDKNLSLLDALNVVSFIIGYLNYEENLTQGDKQDLMHAFDKQTEILLKEIHNHLEIQDKKIDHILEVISDEKNT